jgi:serine 3-dehydrogenase
MQDKKIVFITGASSGIGKACAEHFAAHGYALILTARRLNRLQHIKEGLNTPCLIYALDVRSKEEVEQLVSNLPAEWRNIDILINNAGLAAGLEKIHEGDVQNWEQMIDTNIKGLLYVTRTIVPLMVQRKQGHVVNIGSIAGHENYPNGNVYCATKHAVDSITKCLRIDLVGTPIRVSTVDPGMVNTEFSTVRFKGDTQRAEGVYKGMSPLTAADIADAVFYCVTRPVHVNISELIIMPTAQASTTLVHRELELLNS